jgi:Rrf2 family transcriptional regulator, cysteine metabolism repressor
MMRITAKAEYACLAVIELARSAGVKAPRRVRELAEAQDISEQYLVHILLQLKAAGLVHSSRGSIGGYQLSRDPSDISVAEVIAAIDGRSARPRRYDSTAGRDLAKVLARASEAEWDVLAATTIAQLAHIDANPERAL